jgi:putative peptidoglycan lipid II flippase
MAISNFFRIEPRGVHQAAFLLATTSVANGLLGLFRDRFLAAHFGASRELDIYYAAFRIPDMLFSLSLFFVASTAFIPLFLERKNKSESEAKDFYDSLFSIFFLSMGIIIILAFFVMPYATPYVVPGFDAAARAKTLLISRILLLSPLLLGLSNLVSGVVQASRKFLAYALAPIAYNVGIIFGILILSPRYGLAGIAYGVSVGALLHFLVQVPTLIRLHGLPRFRISMGSKPFQIFRYSFPRATALSLNQLTLFALTALASTLGAGAIAVFNLSNNLYTLPLVVIGLSYSVASFPVMAELALKEDKSLFFEHLLTATRHILFWTMPIAGLFMVLRAHIVRVILGAGAFAWVDTRLTAASLFLFSFAIVTQSLVTLFVRAYYALGKVREPIVYNIIASFVTIFIAVFSVWVMRENESIEIFFGNFLRIGDLRGIQFLSLPLAYSVGALVNALTLGVSIFRISGREEIQQLWRSARSILIISLVMAASAYSVLKLLGFIELSSFTWVFAQGVCAFLAAFGMGIVLSEAMHVREYFEIKQALAGRFIKKAPLQPETEHL